jgi:hypothetical protein
VGQPALATYVRNATIGQGLLIVTATSPAFKPYVE